MAQNIKLAEPVVKKEVKEEAPQKKEEVVHLKMHKKQ